MSEFDPCRTSQLCTRRLQNLDTLSGAVLPEHHFAPQPCSHHPAAACYFHDVERRSNHSHWVLTRQPRQTQATRIKAAKYGSSRKLSTRTPHLHFETPYCWISSQLRVGAVCSKAMARVWTRRRKTHRASCVPAVARSL